MGVQGLWDLVSPAGRRVDADIVSYKTVAVDASIWMFHFVKAMRDESGNMIPGAHLIGFFRRICKLMHLKARPVFVFDGPPPELKRRTLKQRLKIREQVETNVKKTAEKLFRARMKSHLS